jgi:hypothetical protein
VRVDVVVCLATARQQTCNEFRRCLSVLLFVVDGVRPREQADLIRSLSAKEVAHGNVQPGWGGNSWRARFRFGVGAATQELVGVWRAAKPVAEEGRLFVSAALAAAGSDKDRRTAAAREALAERARHTEARQFTSNNAATLAGLFVSTPVLSKQSSFIRFCQAPPLSDAPPDPAVDPFLEEIEFGSEAPLAPHCARKVTREHAYT